MCFLILGMLFTVIVDLSKYKRSKKYFEDKIGYWMNLIVAKVPNAVIMIVPTHLDLVTDHYVVIQSCKHMIQCAHEHIKERQHIIEKGYDENVKKPPKPILPVLPRSYQLEVDGKTEVFIVFLLLIFTFLTNIFKLKPFMYLLCC